MTNDMGRKIAIVINTLKVGGGAERVATYVADSLKDRGHEVAFLLFDDSGLKYLSSVDTFLIGDGKAPSSSLKALSAVFKRGRQITSFCRENKIDTCIGFMEEANFSSVASKLFFGNRSKIICCLRNNPKRKKPMAKFMIKSLYRFADLVVANSSALVKIAADDFGLKKTIAIYNPVFYDRISDLADKPLPEEYRDFFAGDRTFLNIGRLTEQKAQDVLIRAFKLVVDKEPDSRLAIIGEGKDLERLSKISEEERLKGKVVFLGREDNVFPFIKAAAALVLSSRWEGMPNVILEALAVGTPVVSTDCPTGPREIIAESDQGELPIKTDRGVLVRVDDEAMLSRAMIDAIGMERKIAVDDRFKPENVIKEWEKII